MSRPSVNRPEKSSVTGKSIGGEQKQREKKDSTGSENNAGRATGSQAQVKTSEKSIVKTPRREQGEKKQSQRQPRKINKKPVNEIPEQPPRQVITDEAEKKTTMIERAEKPDAVKNESENFGKRNTKKRRPRFDDGDAVQDNESSQNKPANTEGDEGQVSFGRTPKKKTR